VSTAVLGVWALQLAHLANSDDVVVGVTVAGRPVDRIPGVENVLGLFINTLPVRVRARPDDPVTELFGRVQHQQLDSRAYEYSALTDIQAVSNLPPGSRLFEAIFVYENYPVGADSKLSTELVIESTGYPLTFVVETDGMIRMQMHYRRGLFRPESIELMLAGTLRLLHHVVECPHATVADLRAVLDGRR
jgi:non-ribosomal peptide synthetase component F